MKRHFIKLTVCSFVFALCTGVSYSRQMNDTTLSLRQIISNHEKEIMQSESVVVIEKGDNDSKPEFTINIDSNGSFSKDLRHLKITREQLESQLQALCGFNEMYTFGRLRTVNDDLGFSHTDYNVYFDGYLVDGLTVMVHERDGFVTSINGIVRQVDTKIDTIELLDHKATISAMKVLNVTDLVYRYPEQRVLAYVPNADGTSKYKFAKKVRVFSLSPLKKYDVYVDMAGNVIDTVSLIAHTDVQGVANTYYNGAQQIICDSTDSNKYRLRDNARKIATYNGDYWDVDDYPGDNIMYTNTSKHWEDSVLRPALQVHWGMEKIYDYYKNVHGRNSYDGNESNIYNIYNPVALDRQGAAFNAAAIGNGMMIYGRGGTYRGKLYKPLVCFDVAAHEFTHLVTGANGRGGLQYRNESGALNESFSDIFGATIDFYTRGDSANWIMGEEIFNDGSFIRSLSDPKSPTDENDKCPNTYKGQYWYYGSLDHGGVHINSTVQSYWFYLLSHGGSGTNDKGYSYTVTPIGIEAARSIAYRNLMYYLPYTAGYIDAYKGSLLATKDLFGESSTQYRAVIEAWKAVGIDSTMKPEPWRCNGNMDMEGDLGTITDGEGDYTANQVCSWLIEVDDDKVVKLSFTEFDLEPSRNNVFFDYVEVLDVVDSRPRSLGKYAGSTLPPTLYSKSNQMAVIFITDGDNHYKGFTANFTAVDPTKQDIAEYTSPISVFPNPAVDNLYIKFAEVERQVSVVVSDIYGRVVRSMSFGNVSGGDTKNIDISGLSEGVYTVRIVNDTDSRIEKIVIRR